MPQVPERPLKLKSRFVIARWLEAVGLGVGCLAAFSGVVYSEANAIRTLLHDQHLWEQGQLSRGAGVHGRKQSGRFSNTYDLTVTYLDAAHRRHEGRAKFYLLFGSVDPSEPADVRYDPLNPDDFVLSWAMTKVGRRWLDTSCTLLFCSALWVLVGVFLPRQILRQLADWKRVAARSDEVTLKLTKIVTVMKGKKDTGKRRYEFVWEKGQGQVTFKKGEAPLLDPTGTALVALVSPAARDRPVVMHRGMHPFVVNVSLEAWTGASRS